MACVDILYSLHTVYSGKRLYRVTTILGQNMLFACSTFQTFGWGINGDYCTLAMVIHIHNWDSLIPRHAARGLGMIELGLW